MSKLIERSCNGDSALTRSARHPMSARLRRGIVARGANATVVLDDTQLVDPPFARIPDQLGVDHVPVELELCHTIHIVEGSDLAGFAERERDIGTLHAGAGAGICATVCRRTALAAAPFAVSGASITIAPGVAISIGAGISVAVAISLGESGGSGDECDNDLARDQAARQQRGKNKPAAQPSDRVALNSKHGLMPLLPHPHRTERS